MGKRCCTCQLYTLLDLRRGCSSCDLEARAWLFDDVNKEGLEHLLNRVSGDSSRVDIFEDTGLFARDIVVGSYDLRHC